VTRIGDQLAHELGITIHDLRHVWPHNTSHQPQQPYHETDTTPGAAMPTTATLRADFDAILTQAEQDAAKIARYEANPLFAEVVTILEAIPEAGSAIRVAIAGVNALAGAAPSPAPVAQPEPAVVADAPVSTSTDPRSR